MWCSDAGKQPCEEKGSGSQNPSQDLKQELKPWESREKFQHKRRRKSTKQGWQAVFSSPKKTAWEDSSNMQCRAIGEDPRDPWSNASAD